MKHLLTFNLFAGKFVFNKLFMTERKIPFSVRSKQFAKLFFICILIVRQSTFNLNYISGNVMLSAVILMCRIFINSLSNNIINI